MTGVDIIGELLLGSEALLSRVPTANIRAGLFPDGIPLPALLVRHISGIERQNLRRTAKTRTIDRVQVSVRANSYVEQTEIIDLVVKVCAGKTGTIAQAGNVSITTAGRGPDLNGPANSFEQAQDFRVSFDA